MRQKVFHPQPTSEERQGDAERRDMAIASAVTKEPFKPFRIWTAGPGSRQDRIYLGKLNTRLKPNRDGAYHIQTQEQADVARRALKDRWWIDTVDPTVEEVPRCETCTWTSMSHRAMFEHLNQAHGRPQGGR